MSHSQFHCTGRVYLDLHGLIFETSICYWQDQPGSPRGGARGGFPRRGALRSGLAPAAAYPPRREGRADRCRGWVEVSPGCWDVLLVRV